MRTIGTDFVAVTREGIASQGPVARGVDALTVVFCRLGAGAGVGGRGGGEAAEAEEVMVPTVVAPGSGAAAQEVHLYRPSRAIMMRVGGTDLDQG